MGDDIGAGFVAQAVGPTEVVGVGMGDNNGVHIGHPEPGPIEPIDQVPPGLSAGKPRVDDGHPALVFQQVAVHVAETRHRNRQLRAQHARCHFGHLVAGRFLLLLAWPVQAVNVIASTPAM